MHCLVESSFWFKEKKKFVLLIYQDYLFIQLNWKKGCYKAHQEHIGSHSLLTHDKELLWQWGLRDKVVSSSYLPVGMVGMQQIASMVVIFVATECSAAIKLRTDFNVLLIA